MLETPPKKFGRYEVREELGSGAMGVVYLAHDPDIGRDVAIKTIKRTLDLPSPKRGEYLERFKREAKAAGKLSDNPHIVPVFDVGQEGDLPYIVMAYVKGESLDRRRRKHRLDDAALEQLTADICSALGHAHRHGTIHRDVKPANILVTERGAMLTDFGIARLDGSELTRAGTFLGSPSYMSPEQVRGGELTAASDLFSLAVILYLLLTEEKPFKGDDTNEILYKIVNEKHAPPSKYRAESARFDAFFERALAKQAADRFADAAAFLEAFRAVVHGAAPAPAAAATSSGSLSAPTPTPFDRSALPERPINPLEDRTFFRDFKSSVPTRRPSATDSGRVKFVKNGRRRGGHQRRVPLAVWAAIAGVALAIALLFYALRPSDERAAKPAAAETKKEPARERPAAGAKGKQR